MNKKLLTIATLTILLAGQTAMAKDDSEEFLSWLNDGQDMTQVEQSNQFEKVSIKPENKVEDNYKPENDIFSIHYMSNN